MEERGFVLMSRQLKCIGILCMLFAAAVDSCPDNGTMNCDILPTDGLTCSYVKGSPTEEPTYSLDVPTKVKNLRVTPGFASDSKGVCESRLNITWTVSADGSLKYLRGFFLVASFYYYVDGTDRVVYRTFTVNATGTEQLYQTVFVHDCMVPIEKTLYHVELFSLPQNYQERNHATAEIRTANTVAAHNQCDRTGDPRYTYNWTSTMWTSANPSNASIEVCFYTAPPSFNFTSYLIYLLPNKNDPMNMFIELKNVTVDPLKTTPVCEKFINVCPGDYKIHVTPDNNPVGTCHNGDELTSCTATVVDSINMTESEFRRKCKKVPNPYRKNLSKHKNLSKRKNLLKRLKCG